MGNRPIQLDRILTIVYREDTGQIDSQGHPILRDATKAIWARRQSFQAGRDLQSYALPIGQELRQAFVVRSPPSRVFPSLPTRRDLLKRMARFGRWKTTDLSRMTLSEDRARDTFRSFVLPLGKGQQAI